MADEQRQAASAYPMTPQQLEAFYATEYPKLVKTLVLFGATVDEAEDATQKAMADFTKRSRTDQSPAHPIAYVQRAAINFSSRNASATGSACRVNCEAAT